MIQIYIINIYIQHLVFFDGKKKSEEGYEPEIYDGEREEEVSSKINK